jgi:hypothetical protein
VRESSYGELALILLQGNLLPPRLRDTTGHSDTGTRQGHRQIPPIVRLPPLACSTLTPRRCQTYEGGFASAAWPTGLSSPSASAAAEAHGGYTSCALFSHFLLRPAVPQIAEIDTEALLRWAVMQQASAAEGGGFRGRTNKLVDGCYGWWVGGLFAVLEGLVRGDSEGGEKEGDEWEDVTGKGKRVGREVGLS